jgi:opacity protein-like surface antigen
MNNLDNIFKNGLDGKGLKYSDKHWKQLQQQLDKDEKPRKRFLWLWTLGLMSLTIVLYIGINTYKNNTNQSDFQKGTENHHQVSHANSGQYFSGNSTEKPAYVSETPVIDHHQDSEESAHKIATSAKKTHHLSQKEFKHPSIFEESEFSDKGLDAMQPFIESTMEYQRVLSTLEIHQLNLRISGLLKTDNLIKDELNSDTKPLRKLKTKWQWSVAPFISTIDYNKKVAVTDIAGYKSQEKTLPSTGYGLYVFARKKRLAVKTGLAVFSLNEITNYTNTIHHWDYNSSYIVENNNYDKTRSGTPIILIREIVDSTLTTYQETEHPNSEVKFSYLTVPLHVQYEIGKKRWVGFAGFGINLSFLRSSKGIYASNFEHNITSEANLFYEDISSRQNISKLLTDGEINAGLKYRLTKNTAFLMGYAYSQSINSMMSTYNQKAILHQIRFGVEIGIR